MAHWREPDHGLWEEQGLRQYTSSKVIMACGLEYIAEYGTPQQAERWRAAAAAIRRYVAADSLTPGGAYAAVAGGQNVDVSAALFPVWAYCDADTPEMLVSIAAIERDLAEGDLYHRRLEEFPSAQEGVFLAGALWMAQYWIVRRDAEKAKRGINAVLRFANDLGFLAEEAAPRTGDMVGNFPQSFVHAALIGTVFDLDNLINDIDQYPKED